MLETEPRVGLLLVVLELVESVSVTEVSVEETGPSIRSLPERRDPCPRTLPEPGVVLVASDRSPRSMRQPVAVELKGRPGAGSAARVPPVEEMRQVAALSGPLPSEPRVDRLWTAPAGRQAFL
jgi:hypothetical protein